MLESENRRLQAKVEELQSSAASAVSGLRGFMPSSAVGRTAMMAVLLTFAFVMLPPIGGLAGGRGGLSGDVALAGGRPAMWHSRTLQAAPRLLDYKPERSVDNKKIYPLGQVAPSGAGRMPPRALALPQSRSVKMVYLCVSEALQPCFVTGPSQICLGLCSNLALTSLFPPGATTSWLRCFGSMNRALCSTLQSTTARAV